MTGQAVIRQAFRQVPKPPEVGNLPQLQSMAEAAQARGHVRRTRS
ncbi:hypothetical protein FHU39_004615 [Flexivirga oryzae]|uniref:Uncharacterized protein n=1 Tax=Flexivirga oryzae TaxID=1794944 RepID=A0A839NCI2_9MICO|nr:hypothetical protein [Flexivirga oryzae]